MLLDRPYLSTEGIINIDELQSLVVLMEDTDPTVRSAVTQRFVEIGPRCIPALTQMLAAATDSEQRNNIEDVIRSFKSDALLRLVRLLNLHLQTQTTIELEEAMRLLDRFGHPELSSDNVPRILDELALRIHEVFITKTPANDLTHLLSITSVLFDEEGFVGAGTDYYNPDNSYLSTVVEHKRGIPLSLAVLVMLLAERGGLTVLGVGMPFHFLLRLPEFEMFLDPFNGGTFVTRDDCKRFVEKSGGEFSDTMLKTVNSNDVVIRSLRNLHYAHQKFGNTWEAEQLAQAITTLNIEEQL